MAQYTLMDTLRRWWWDSLYELAGLAFGLTTRPEQVTYEQPDSECTNRELPGPISKDRGDKVFIVLNEKCNPQVVEPDDAEITKYPRGQNQ